MTGLFLISYLLAPALMLACCLGCGLLVRRLAGGRLPGIYVLPLGLATLVAIGAFLTTWDSTAEMTGPAFVVVAIAGLVVERQRLRPAWAPVARWAWPAGAALAAYVVMSAPALLSGRPTFTGYARIVDLAHQFDFARYLVTEGRLRPPARDTSYLEVVTKTLDIGYPGGGQSVFGGFASVLGTDLAWIYQAFLAITVAMTALAVYALLRGAVRSPPLRAVAGGTAAQANVTIGYGLVGGFKELLTAALLVLAAALIRETAPGREPVRAMLPLAVVTAACLGAFNLTVVPWLGLLLASFFVITMARGGLRSPRARLRPLGAWAVMAALTLAIAAPTLWEAAKLAPVAVQAEGADRTVIADLGNLSAAMPVRAAAGVWIGGDFRNPVLGDTPATRVGIVLVAALAVVGVATAVRRRDWSVALIGVASAVALAYFSLRTGPWIQLKAIAVTGPVALALAFAGAGWLAGRRTHGGMPLRSVLAWGAAGVVSLGVLAGNANAYHDVTLAPTDRLRDLEQIGRRFAGVGPALYPAFEEYAEYFLRESQAVSPVNTAGEGPLAPLAYRPEAAAQAGAEAAQGRTRQAWDLDDFEPGYVQQFELLVVRRGPASSRAPSNYALAERTRFHDVWRRVRPSRSVLMHVPAADSPSMQQEGRCVEFERRVAQAPAGARVVYALGPKTAGGKLGAGRRSPAWTSDDPASVVPYGAGFAEAPFELEAGGTYGVWLRGPVQRELRVLVDGQKVAALEGGWSYPLQWSLLTRVRLPMGAHAVRVERDGGNLEPGDGAGGQAIGPVAFERLDGSRGQLRTAPSEQAGELCRAVEGIDWVELLRPAGGAPHHIDALAARP